MEHRRLTTAAVMLIALLWGVVFSQGLRVDGSSTLNPLFQAAAIEFTERRPGVDVDVSFSGTAGGFVSLCRSEAQLIGASRKALPEELEACELEEVPLLELPLAFDRITVVVSSGNEWLECLGLDELRRLWTEGSTIRKWSDLRPEWPDLEVQLYAPGVASGTHDVFADRVLNGASLRTDFFPSEDDAVLAHAVSVDEAAITFFGRAQYQRAQAELRPVTIAPESGCGAPSRGPDESAMREVAEPGQLLVRPLFLYVDARALVPESEAAEFVEFLLSQRMRGLMVELGYIPLDHEEWLLARKLLREAVPAGAGEADGG